MVGFGPVARRHRRDPTAKESRHWTHRRWCALRAGAHPPTAWRASLPRPSATGWARASCPPRSRSLPPGRSGTCPRAPSPATCGPSTYLGDRIAEELERIASHWTHATTRRRELRLVHSRPERYGKSRNGPRWGLSPPRPPSSSTWRPRGKECQGLLRQPHQHDVQSRFRYPLRA